jgi:aspartate aminotransferase-like enzyme
MTEHEVLFIPGPVEVDAELRAIMAQPMIGHRNPKFVDEVKTVCDKLQLVFQTDCATSGSTTLFENAPATAVMEAGIRNLVPRGGRVLHLACGAFSERWAKISAACGREADVLAVDWGQSVRADALAAKLEASEPFAAVCVTHSETSTGVLAPLAEMAAVVREVSPESLVLVDAVTSLGGAELRFDDWGLDLALAGTQKCLALPPGLVVYAVSARAIERAGGIEERGFLLDFLKAKKGLADGKTPATPCVPLVFALSHQLDRIAKEGMDRRWQRHLDMQSHTLEWAAVNGFEPFVDEGFRSPTVTTLRAPGRDIMDLAARAKAAGFAMDKGYGKLKGQAFRIGHMGDHTVERVQRLLAALL